MDVTGSPVHWFKDWLTKWIGSMSSIWANQIMADTMNYKVNIDASLDWSRGSVFEFQRANSQSIKHLARLRFNEKSLLDNGHI